MNENIILEISKELNVESKYVKVVLDLLKDGNTIPFISRYRKEATNKMDEVQIKHIEEVYSYQVNLLKRKEDVIRLINEKGLLTNELSDKIMLCEKLIEIEDLYRPYKEKKKTKATDAINNGLEPLAKIIMSFKVNSSLEELTSKFIKDNVKNEEEAINGAMYIISEWISDNAFYRKYIRNIVFNEGLIVCKEKKNMDDKNKTYEMYYDYSEQIKYIKSHRILAINRGEKENVLSVSLKVDNEKILKYLESKIVKDKNNICVNIIINAIKDSYKRLIFPSIEREIRSELTVRASTDAIKNFGNNLEKLLLTPPIKGRMVLGYDPAFRTGCKLAVLDNTGKMLEVKVIYPNEPRNDFEGSKKILIDLINKYNISIIAIGNGTASRESEAFVSKIIKENNLKCEYIIVSEAGASVYSASKLAIEEFPNLHVEERSAISIGRRLLDPLSELVKIDPESIGVGLYQHDVNDKELSDSLDFVVSTCVNSVGVNINTASTSLLKYVSGLTKKSIEKLIILRDKLGLIKSRSDIKSILKDKTYEQAIGFLRIFNGDNPLDSTSIHPESYDVTLNLIKLLDLGINDIGSELLNNKLKDIDIDELSKSLNVDKYTLEDIIECLKKPTLDPRDGREKPLLKSDILDIKDLKKGMHLQGTVRNVIDFGAFVDIGLHNDGLIHISKMSNNYIKHPSEILSVGDIVDVYVDDIFLDKQKVSLSLLKP